MFSGGWFRAGAPAGGGSQRAARLLESRAQPGRVLRSQQHPGLLLHQPGHAVAGHEIRTLPWIHDLKNVTDWLSLFKDNWVKLTIVYLSRYYIYTYLYYISTSMWRCSKFCKICSRWTWKNTCNNNCGVETLILEVLSLWWQCSARSLILHRSPVSSCSSVLAVVTMSTSSADNQPASQPESEPMDSRPWWAARYLFIVYPLLSILSIYCLCAAMTMTRLPIADIAMLPIYVSTVGGVTAPVFALAKCTSRRTWVSYTKTVMPPPLPGLPGLGPTFSQCHRSDQKLHLAFQFTIKWPLQDLSLTPIEGDVTKYPEAVQWGIKHFKQEFIQKSRITSCKLETFSPFSHW